MEESRLNKLPALRKPACDLTAVGRQSRRDHDSDLITSVAMGNREAFQELYVKYRRRLAYFIARMNRCHEDAEEIINDTLMTVWQSAGEFRHASQVSTWIFGIAYRKALTSFRRHRRDTSNVPLEEAAEQSTDPMQEMEMHDWLTRGLRQLPLDQRLTMQLSYKLGLCLEEIAAITEVPIGTAKARQFLARSRLRRCLPTLGGGTQFSYAAKHTVPVRGTSLVIRKMARDRRSKESDKSRLVARTAVAEAAS